MKHLILVALLTIIPATTYAASKPVKSPIIIWQSNEMLASTLGFGSTASAPQPSKKLLTMLVKKYTKK